MHPDVAGDGDPAPGHAAADPLDPAEVAAERQLVAGRALDLEEVVEAALPLPQEHRQARIAA